MNTADFVDYFGNKALLDLPKTAFLCSRTIPASAVLKCYDWAISQRESGKCVISGFHSKIEKDVLHYLLSGNQPLIITLARGLKERLDTEFEEASNRERILFITPFQKNVRRVSSETAEKRNRLMIDLADEVVIGHISKGGALERLVSEYGNIRKVTVL